MFIDVTDKGDVWVKEYEDHANHLAVLVSFGGEGPSIKMAAEQAKTLRSALLRIYESVAS